MCKMIIVTNVKWFIQDHSRSSVLGVSTGKPIRNKIIGLRIIGLMLALFLKLLNI